VNKVLEIRAQKKGTLLIREVAGSNLGSETLADAFRSFSQSLQENAKIVP
jgi:hypothetical protein